MYVRPHGLRHLPEKLSWGYLKTRLQYVYYPALYRTETNITERVMGHDYHKKLIFPPNTAARKTYYAKRENYAITLIES